jgi:hypothetical protein
MMEKNTKGDAAELPAAFVADGPKVAPKWTQLYRPTELAPSSSVPKMVVFQRQDLGGSCPTRDFRAGAGRRRSNRPYACCTPVSTDPRRRPSASVAQHAGSKGARPAQVRRSILANKTASFLGSTLSAFITKAISGSVNSCRQDRNSSHERWSRMSVLLQTGRLERSSGRDGDAGRNLSPRERSYRRRYGRSHQPARAGGAQALKGGLHPLTAGQAVMSILRLTETKFQSPKSLSARSARHP